MRNIEHLRTEAAKVDLTEDELAEVLSPRGILALELFREGLSIADIAERMGVQRGTAAERLKESIRKALYVQGSWKVGMPRTLRKYGLPRHPKLPHGVRNGEWITSKELLKEAMLAVDPKRRSQNWYRDGMRWLELAIGDEHKPRCQCCGQVIRKSSLK